MRLKIANQLFSSSVTRKHIFCVRVFSIHFVVVIGTLCFVCCSPLLYIFVHGRILCALKLQQKKYSILSCVARSFFVNRIETVFHQPMLLLLKLNGLNVCRFVDTIFLFGRFKRLCDLHLSLCANIVSFCFFHIIWKFDRSTSILSLCTRLSRRVCFVVVCAKCSLQHFLYVEFIAI